MTACPSETQLLCFLDEPIADVAEHVEDCVVCQQALERLTADPTPELPSAPSVHIDELSSPAEQFLRELAERTYNGETPPLRTASSTALPVVAGYEVREEIGRGGMGVVYLAVQTALKRPVALKMLPADSRLRPEDVARFRTEAEAVARLQHPHIVQIYEVGEHDGRPFFSLEFVPGGTLARRLAGTPLAPPAAAGVVETLASAVHYAHEHGIIHRDLKPANILLVGNNANSNPKSERARGTSAGSRTDVLPSSLSEAGVAIAAFTPKVSDFGLAKRLEEETGQTETGQILGTPSYMAPEQACGHVHAIGPATDVYALGALLYECLTGRPPFKGASPLDTLEQVRHQEAVPVRRLQPSVPRDLETICLKCLQKDSPRRYASALALAEDLRRFQVGEPIAARPIGRAERLARWCWRHPARALVVVLGTLLLALAVALFAVDYARGIQHRKELEAANTEAIQGRRSAERQLALNYFDYALNWCEQNQIGHGLLWMVRSLETLRDGDPDLERELRLAMTTWQRHLAGLVGLLPHLKEVSTVAFSRDGSKLVTASLDGTARVWDGTTGRPLTEPLRHDGPVGCVALSPDCRTLVTGCADKTARLWSTATGQPLGKVLRHRHTVWSVAFRPDGQAVATASLDGNVCLWDAATGERLGAPLEHGRPVWAVVFRPDGKLLATGCSDGTVRLWSVPGGAPARLPLRHAVPVTRLAFRPDGKALASAGDDRDVFLWGLEHGEELIARLTHQGTVECLAFSPDGKLLASGNQDNHVRLWSATTGQAVGAPMAHGGTVRSIAFSADGTALVSGGDDRNARLWSVPRGVPLGPPLPHRQTVRAVAFHPDGSRIATAGEEGCGRLWLLPPGAEAGPLLPHREYVLAVAFSPNGQQVATAGHHSPVCLWSTSTGELQHRLEHGPDNQGRPCDVPALAFRGDGRALATAGGDRTVRLWSPENGQLLQPPLKHCGPVSAVAFSPNGDWLATASQDQSARLWDLRRRGGATPHGPPWKHPTAVLMLAFSPEGRTVATGGDDPAVRLWSAETGGLRATLDLQRGAPRGLAFRPDGEGLAVVGQRSCLWSLSALDSFRPLAHDEQARALAFSRDGTRLATGSEDRFARLWDATTGRLLTRPLAHGAAVLAVAFSPDGTVLLTGAGDNKLRLWGAVTGRALGPPLEHSHPVNALALSPDGRTFAAASGTSPVRLWRLAAPTKADVGELELAVQLFVGMELDEQGSLRSLDTAEWQKRRTRLLERLGTVSLLECSLPVPAVNHFR